MNTSRLLHLLVVTTATIMKANAEADDHSILAKGLSVLRGMYLEPVGKKKKTESLKHVVRRILNKGTTNIFSRAREQNKMNTCRLWNLVVVPDYVCDAIDFFKPGPLVTCSPIASPTPSPTYIEKKFLASDGASSEYFGGSCSMRWRDDLVVFGATGANDYHGAAYLFSLDGTELSKLEPEDNGEAISQLGYVVSIDEIIAVGAYTNYIPLFSHEGEYVRTLTCEPICSGAFGWAVATLYNIIVTHEHNKLLIYSTHDGDLVKEFEEEESLIRDVAISYEYIVSTTETKTVVYSNSAPDFPLVVEIEQGGRKVATEGDKLLITDSSDANSYVGSAWLYNIDGTLVKELEHDITTPYSHFGSSIAITRKKILVGFPSDDEGGDDAGAVFIYSAIDGSFQEKVVAPDAQEGDGFGSCVSATDSYYVVGASGYDSNTGAGYLFNLPS